PHPDVTVFNDHMEIPGLGFLPINAFLLHAAQPVVIDTGLGLPDRDFVSSLAEVIDPKDVRWIWLTHPDRDHTGGLFSLLDAAPHARVVTTFGGAGIMSTERPLPMDRVYLLNPGQRLDVGDRTLTGIRPPLWDSAATVGVFDGKSGVLFSSDCFGAPLASVEYACATNVAAVPADDLRNAQLLWSSVDSPWVQQVDPARFQQSLSPVRDLDPSWIFSVHLPPIHENTAGMLENVSLAPTASEFVGPDQAALEAMLASFEPQQVVAPA
ncbi:MAG TPA: MBL fold metallo-hydrolase, partial [Jatrophihabitans sp.]|nr:MBL fold metallo-hydrolase [Jatrophihabitans sp.]